MLDDDLKRIPECVFVVHLRYMNLYAWLLDRASVSIINHISRDYE